MSNREIQSFNYTLGNTGILLKSSADEIPLTSYSYLKNAFTDRENTLTIRRGWAKIGTTPSATKNYPDGYLKTSPTVSYRYASANTTWCRASVDGAYNSIASGLSGNTPVATVNTLANIPYIFLADGTKFIKDYGTGNATDVGLEQPDSALTLAEAEVSGADRIVIDDFDSGISGWATTLLAGTGTATVTSISDGYVSNAMRVTLSAASGLGRAVKNMSLDLGNADDLTIELYVRIPTEAAATNLVKATLMFSIGDTTFSTRYEKSIEINPFQGTTNTSYAGIISAADAQAAWLQGLNARLAAGGSDYAVRYGSGDPEIMNAINGAYNAYMQQVAAHNASIYSSLQIPVGTNTWNIIRVSKSEFSRVGTTGQTDPTLDWSLVRAVAIEIQSSVTAGTSFDIDQWAYRSKGQITGTNIAYTFTYYDSQTETESDYADITDVPYPGATGDQFQLTFIDTPPANATHRKIYRIGGAIEQFQLVATIPIATTVYVDDSADTDLTDILNLDNQNVPGIPRGVSAYDNRLFVWGIVEEPPNRLRFSKRNKLETFPTDYWIPVGDGSETIVRCVEFDGELIIFTLSRVYRLIGTDEFSYRAISTRITQGLTSISGLAKSTSSLYMSSYDGIYEYPSGKRISEAINPMWRGQTVNGYPPLLMANMDKICLGYHNQKLYVSYSDNINDEGNSNLLVYDLGYERWHWYQYGASQMFSEPADTSIDKPAALLAGVYSGSPSANNGAYVHEIETGSVDQKVSSTIGIDYIVMTKELDMGSPDREKQIIDLVLDVDTNGTDMSVYYAVDTGVMDTASISMTLAGTINTGTNGRQQKIVPFPTVDGLSLYGKRLLLKLTGTTSINATYDNQIKIYKIIPRFLIEPERHSTFTTDWAGEGTNDEKIWRELHIEYNSYGIAPTFYIDIDGVNVYSFLGTAVNYRKKFYYALPVTSDLTGTMARLRVVMSSGEIKIYDYNIGSIPLANPVTTFETPWSDEGAPNIFKRFRKLIVEADNIGGGTITVTPEVDGVSLTPYTITASGRLENVYSFPVDTTGHLWRIRVTTTTTVRIYSVKVEALPDPTHVTTYESAWSNEGTINRKRFRDIVIDLDTNSSSVTVTPWIDYVALTPFTVTTTGRETRILTLPIDTTGKLVRITTTGGSAHTVYSHRVTYVEEPHFGIVRETQWSDEGYPYDKLWKHFTLDFDTGGQEINIYLWIDGEIVQTWPVTTNGRELRTFSIMPDLIGKLGRITTGEIPVDPGPPLGPT